MTINPENVLESIMKSLSRIEYLQPNDIPSIPLYMDQVTSLLDESMRGMKRYPDDKILTKTMINNYAKNNLLPPPVKKKYEKEHVIMLIFIYYFKNILSIKDIEKLLHPLAMEHFGSNENLDVTDIYTEVLNMQQSCIDDIMKDVSLSFENTQKSFVDTEDKNEEFLKIFSFICTLSVDVFVKKQIIEELIDTLPILNESKEEE